MRVVICPDKFAGTLTAVEAAQAIAEGWRSVAPGDELVLRPVADGGPGFLEVLHTSLGGDLIEVPTTDPLGRVVTGSVLIVGDTAYLESAQATGLHHLAPGERDPKITTSAGLGALVAAATAQGAHKLIIGLGGSATNDGGAGFLAALGFKPLDREGNPLPPGGAVLRRAAALTLPTSAAPAPPAAITTILPARGVGGAAAGQRWVELVGASDVDNPLVGEQGATAVYGPQKGASAADVVLLDAALANWAAVLQRDLPGCPQDLAALKGAGAAGGLGAAVLALGGRIVSGIDLILTETGLGEAVAEAGVVITGEGSFDHQSLRGKVIAGVAGAARDHGVPCVVLAGRVTTGRREQGAAGITEAHSLVDHFGDVDLAMTAPARGLRELSARMAGQYSRR
ncbi:glycerate kinase [Rhizocola hellebori]|uniref:Glycerate kinase n=1 Tax=Rhizocola hellebori TaxID=1392758 RepID=A0A8J3QDK2_9ACTN|nr:glycerate kinase [Rhizocola hellebori]GIH08789.1 glycerate kinase [Rhizocola hellebori]